MKIEWVEKCQECKGTGVYVGFLERNSDYGVVCNICKGTGKRHKQFEYEEFQGKEISSVNKVLETNPGIMIGETNYDMGGISYQEWYNGKEFPVESEMREYTCPAWWFQYANYSKKPNWDECLFPGIFSSCQYFSNKHKCWERWDIENKKMSENEELDFDNPYCVSCGACGETDCCSPFECLRKSVSKNKDCKHGETYLKEVELYYELGNKLYDLILKKGNMENVKIVNKIYNELFKEIYGRER